jgi:hypothetical protein
MHETGCSELDAAIEIARKIDRARNHSARMRAVKARREKGLRVVALTREQAAGFVAEHHRHHGPLKIDKYRIGAAMGDKLAGLAQVGRPVGGAGADRIHRRDPGPPDGFWRAADWLCCRDGKWRPVEPGAFPLAHGVPARTGRLRAYGNAVVPQVAAAFIRAFLRFCASVEG